MLLTRLPLSGNPIPLRASTLLPWATSFDLHVLGMPPAFILSQDQTLQKKFILFLFFLLVFLTSGINVLLSFQRSFRFLVESTTNISFAFFIVNTFF